MSFVNAKLGDVGSPLPGESTDLPARSDPEELMVNAAVVDVAKVLGDEVAMKSELPAARKVHASFVSEPSVSASCGRVDEATVSAHRGEVVPIPKPDCRTVAAVIAPALPSWNWMSSAPTPAALVARKESDELTAAPPIRIGVVTDVPIVGAALNDGAPAFAIRIELAAPCAVAAIAPVPAPYSTPFVV